MGRLTAIVLGAAAGGGFPQWNCRCTVCGLAWDGDGRVLRSTQASLAISVDGRAFILLNASPDLREQIAATPALQPASGLRGSPIAAVVLTGAEIDQTAGLLALRERHAFAICGSAETLRTVAANPMFNVLASDLVERRACPIGEAFSLVDGLQAELFKVPGKVPLYLEGANPELAAETEANVGVELVCDGRRLVFVPGCAAVTPALMARLARADALLFDGTLFTDDEMIRNETGTKTGRRMGHMPIDGADGSLAALASLPGRRIYIHINNTNPIRVAGSPERRKVEAAGWEIAADGNLRSPLLNVIPRRSAARDDALQTRSQGGNDKAETMKLLSADELEAQLRDIGARRYHRLHPFHHLLHGGKCTKGQVQAWAATATITRP